MPVPLYRDTNPYWNMVGYPSNENRPGTEALGNLRFGVEVTVIYYYDATTGQHIWMDPDTDEFELGRGYYFWMAELPSPSEWRVPLAP